MTSPDRMRMCGFGASLFSQLLLPLLIAAERVAHMSVRMCVRLERGGADNVMDNMLMDESAPRATASKSSRPFLSLSFERYDGSAQAIKKPTFGARLLVLGGG